MGEREMLELAARAAGIELVTIDGALYFKDHALGNEWRPQHDDGQALRLANKLCICMEFGYCEDDAPVLWVGQIEQRRNWKRYPHFPDPDAATSRAIVLAAAEIGAQQEGARHET